MAGYNRLGKARTLLFTDIFYGLPQEVKGENNFSCFLFDVHKRIPSFLFKLTSPRQV